MAARSYRQNCGIARSLDLLGERWTLLVIRELVLGPRRYGDLLESLPGIGTNLLAARLKRLEEAGVVRRAVLPRPARVPVYELTADGEELRAALEALAVWGYRLIPPPEENADRYRATWAALSMQAVLDRHGAPAAAEGLFEFLVEDEAFWVRVAGGEATVRAGLAPVAADVTARADLMSFLGLADRRLTLSAALRERRVEVRGDPARLEALLRVFHLPERAAVPAAEDRQDLSVKRNAVV